MTLLDQRPTNILRDNGSKEGHAFAQVAEENVVCERFLGSVRRTCLDHALVLGEAHLRRILREYMAYGNGARPQQGRQQRLPAAPEEGTTGVAWGGSVRALALLGNLHHAYERAA